MKTTFSQEQRRRGKRLWAAAAAVALGLAVAGASAQLAITEVMSSAATTYQGTNLDARGSDWFEVTNFGTNANSIPLGGYTFSDSGDLPRKPECFIGVSLGPGQSAIFFRSNAPANTVEQFRLWWGNCLPSTVSVTYWSGQPGFDNRNDGVRLYDDKGNLVDRVDFGLARAGVTFVNDTNNGEFGVYSTLGACGTCGAVTADDIGSPGTTCGPVALRILDPPASQSNVCSGLDVVFCVRASGLPRPKYQWLFKGAPIPGANAACLTVTDAQASHQGEYRVVVTNGLEMVLSTPAYLTVDTTPAPPRLYSRFNDVERFVGEKAVFQAQVCALPRAWFQWSSNGVGIVGATNSALVVPSVTLAMSGTLYCVSITNQLGSIQASARLWVSPRPVLEISEVMPVPSTNGIHLGHGDWWELTNRDTNVVKLRKGTRHSDRYSLAGAKTNTQDICLYPGESAIFVAGMTREDFIKWWGECNLPPNLPVITYTGFGLSPFGDEIYFWSAAAEAVNESLASISYAPPPDEPWPMGVSMWFDCCDTNDIWAALGYYSVEGVRWAFRSEESDDIGSPGHAKHLMNPRGLATLMKLSITQGSVTLVWQAIKGEAYQLQWQSELNRGVWMTDGFAHTAQCWTLTTTNALPPGERQRFYRLLELP